MSNNLTKGWRTNDEQITVDRLNAEIQSLKQVNGALDRLLRSHTIQRDDAYVLITELADALEDAFGNRYLTSIGREKLLKRAREATR